MAILNKWISNTSVFKGLLYFILPILSIFLFTHISKWTIIHSGINYDFENLLNLNLASYLSLIFILLLLLSIFYLSYKSILKIKELRLNNWTRISCLLGSTLISIPIFYLIHIDIPPFPYYLSIVSFLFLADLFIDKRETSIIWIIFWMITLCSLSSILLFNSYLKYDVNKKLAFAKSLIHEKDESIVKELSLLDKYLRDQNSLHFLDSIPYPLKIHKVEFTQILSEIFQQYENIDDQSKAILNAYDKYGNSVVYDQYTTKAFYDDLIKNSIALDTNKYFDPVSNTYLLRSFHQLKYHPDGPFSIYMEFLSNDMIEDPARLLPYTFQRYQKEPDYAVYLNGNLKSTNNYYFNKSSEKTKPLEPGDFLSYNEGGNSHLFYKVDERISIHIQHKFARIIKPISLFSCLFILMGGLLIAITLLNTKWPFLPSQLLLRLQNISSLRRKIQLSVIVLSILSFIAIGIVTIYYFRYLSAEYDNDLIREKTVAITADINARLQEIENEKQALNRLEISLHDISETHKTDIHLFGNTGKLMNSSTPKLFELGYFSNTLNRAMIKLLENQNGVYILPEYSKVGNVSFRNIFIPIGIDDGTKNLAYLQLLHTPQLQAKNNVTDFVGTLLNVYVFLFLLAGAIALAVANSITRPISVLGEQIKNFKLGRKNKKLEWDSEDELGELIRNYNRMAEQLDESAMLIAKTERDSAWKEMAKQVAHEIKNPLTPMKLSIQYMQKAIENNQTDPEKLIDRISHTLIEQIDNLSQIASEFSNFGTMPQGNNEKIILNEIVETIHDLFRKRDDMDIHMTEPLDEIYVFADRNHLIRILNNIVKNAIQAIPTDRRGKIELKLFKKNSLAIIQISDNGIGIADHMKDKVFTPNFTTKSSGTGLGLAIAANLIETFNGRIYFKTIPGDGTDFFVEIPLMHLKDNFEEVKRVSLELNEKEI